MTVERCPEMSNGQQCNLVAGHVGPHQLPPSAWVAAPAPSKKRGSSRRDLMIVGALAVLLFGGALVGGLVIRSRPSVPGSGTNPAPAGLESQMTVTVDVCDSDHAAGSVINYSGVTVDVYIEVQFLSAGGVVLDDGIDNVRGIQPREAANWDAAYLGDQTVADCRANVSSAFAQ